MVQHEDNIYDQFIFNKDIKAIQLKKESSFHKMLLGTIGYLQAKKKKKNVPTIPTSQRTQKINLKWSINPKAIKFKNFWGKYL